MEKGTVEKSKSFNTPGFRAGDWIAISGQTGRVGETLVPGGFEAECKQALQNIARILESNGLPLTSVVKINVYLAEMADRDALNVIYMDFFKGHLPARTTVGVNQLSRNARIEIEGWAYAGEPSA
jgi:2-iminobutanoate/2-iminopropanoate deaminase